MNLVIELLMKLWHRKLANADKYFQELYEKENRLTK
jgi:hypothetical protein